MVFSRLRVLLERKSVDTPALNQLDKQNKATFFWETKGTALFPENLQEHIKKHVRIVSVRNDQITIQVSDNKIATIMLLQRKKLQEIFSSAFPQEPLKQIIIHQN